MYNAELRYLSTFLTVTVPDVDAAAEWYSAAFGLHALNGGADGEGRWLHLRRGEGQDFVLVETKGRWRLRIGALVGFLRGLLRLQAMGPTLYVAVDQDLAHFSDAAFKQGARRVQGAPGGESANAVALRDPYGNEWSFFRRSPGPRAAAQSPSERPPKRKRGTPLGRTRARRRAWRG